MSLRGLASLAFLLPCCFANDESRCTSPIGAESEAGGQSLLQVKRESASKGYSYSGAVYQAVPLSDSSSSKSSLPQPDLAILDAAYEGKFNDTDSSLMSSSQEEEKDVMIKALGEGDATINAHVYGEVRPDRIVQILRHPLLNLRHGQRIYDLGSGAGKAASIAWLLGLNATGIEFSESRSATACNALERLRQTEKSSLGGLEFLNGDFLQSNISDADVVYCSSIMFGPKLMQGLGRLGGMLKEGALVVSSRAFPDPPEGPKLYEHVATLVGATEVQNVDLSFHIQRRVGPPPSMGKPGCVEGEGGSACASKPAFSGCLL